MIKATLVTLAVMLLTLYLAPQFAGSRPPVRLIETADAPLNVEPPGVAPVFRDVTLQMGLFHQHRQESEDVSDIKDVLGAGLCIGDIDGDHVDDLIFTTGSGSTRDYGRPSWWLNHSGIVAYLNRVSHFEERTADLGLSMTDATMGCLLADLDVDGDNDLLVTSFRGSHLYLNDAGERFEKVDTFIGRRWRGWATGASLEDVNADGLPDVFLTGYLKYAKNQTTLELASGFADARERRFDPGLYDGHANLLLINEGAGEFTDATQAYFPAHDLDRSLGALWFDANGDAADDLLVLNDAGSHSRLYLRHPDGHYAEGTELLEPFRLLASNHAVYNAPGELLITRPLGRGHTFLRPSGDGTLSDKAWSATINTTRSVNFSAWGAAAADFDLDGQQDYFLAAGMRSPDSYAAKRSVGQPNSLLVRRGGSFQHIDDFGATRVAGSSRSTGTTDLNLDGRPDLIITNNNAAPQILLNVTEVGGSWIALKTSSSERLTVTLRQEDWNHRTILDNQPLFLGSQQGFQVIAIPNAEPVSATFTGAGRSRTVTLAPNRHYVHRLEEVAPLASPTPSAASGRAAADTWQQAPVYIQEARVQSKLRRPARLQPDEVSEIAAVLSMERHSSPGLRQRLLGLPPRLELLPVYLSLLESDEPETALLSLQAIDKLESDLATDYLLPRLAEQTELTCPLAHMFRRWYREEEAATNSKFLAVPYLIRMLNSGNEAAIACAAGALAESEHLTAAPALVEAYAVATSPLARRAIIDALGAIRQRLALDFLNASFARTRDPDLRVAIAIALNRLDPRLGDERIQALLSLEEPPDQVELSARVLFPENRVHFLPATVQAATEAAGRVDGPTWQALSAEAQLALATIDDRQPVPAVLRQGLESAHPFLRTAARELLDGIEVMDANLAAALFTSTGWQELSPEIKRRALAGLDADTLVHATEDFDLRRNVMNALSLMTPEQTLTVLNQLKKVDTARHPLAPQNCQSPVEALDGDSFRRVADEAHSPLAGALLAPALADRLSSRDFRDWLHDRLEASGDAAHRLLKCLARLDVASGTRRKLNLSVLSLPDDAEAEKRTWLLNSSREDALIATGINSRLRRREAEFASAYLLATPAAEVGREQLDLLAAFPPDSAPARFAELMRPLTTIGQVHP